MQKFFDPAGYRTWFSKMKGCYTTNTPIQSFFTIFKILYTFLSCFFFNNLHRSSTVAFLTFPFASAIVLLAMDTDLLRSIRFSYFILSLFNSGSIIRWFSLGFKNLGGEKSKLIFIFMSFTETSVLTVQSDSVESSLVFFGGCEGPKNFF